jgi:hypothetical protein
MNLRGERLKYPASLPDRRPQFWPRFVPTRVLHVEQPHGRHEPTGVHGKGDPDEQKRGGVAHRHWYCHTKSEYKCGAESEAQAASTLTGRRARHVSSARNSGTGASTGSPATTRPRGASATGASSSAPEPPAASPRGSLRPPGASHLSAPHPRILEAVPSRSRPQYRRHRPAWRLPIPSGSPRGRDSRERGQEATVCSYLLALG